MAHGCGHTRQHNIPAALNLATSQSIQLKLVHQTCSECVLAVAWEKFGFAPTADSVGPDIAA